MGTMMLPFEGFRSGFRAIQLIGMLLASPGFSIAQTLHGDSAVGERATGSVAPGQSVFGKSDFIEYIVGNLPLVISVPHGGYLKLSTIPDRTLGTAGHQDTKTQELAREIIDIFREETGKFPHVIINRLHREKLDANREFFDAAQDDPIAGQAWNEFHSFVNSAEERVEREFGRGLYIDLHGHRHEWQVIELGYLLVSNQLKMTNAELDDSVQASTTSLGLNPGKEPSPLSQLVRGPQSFGASMEREGFATVPSPAHPGPDGRPYFSGGYSLEQHSSFSGKPMLGIQVETPLSVREDADRRKAFAKAFVRAVIGFMEAIASGTHR
jgi:N-formylglutamate amidohydrolase